MIDRSKHIYRHRAADFERLVAREDYQGNLFAALNDIRPLDGLDVVEFGAGTGRLTRLLSVQARRIHAFDLEPAMLAEAQINMLRTGMNNWSLALADNARMSLVAGCADLVVEGWSFGHTVHWQRADGLRQVDAMLAEMRRILRPGGVAILIETMGTGQRQPAAPSQELAKLYDYWRGEKGFQYRWIRTDFHFASPAEADELLRFFFGDHDAAAWLSPDQVIVPECTGIWWRQYD